MMYYNLIFLFAFFVSEVSEAYYNLMFFFVLFVYEASDANVTQ